MTAREHAVRPEELLAHADWVRALARRLVFDPERVDDVVQEAWVEALERPPRHARNLRSWLGDVVRNAARGGGRRDARLARREREAARGDELPAAAAVVEEASLQRDLVGRVLELEEPYRSVLLLRFFRDLPPRSIAAELDVPVATVKTQLQRGLAGLRKDLDEEYGERERWCRAFLPLAGTAAGAGGSAAKAGAVAVLWKLGLAAAIVAAIAWPFLPERRQEEAAKRPVSPSAEAPLIAADVAPGRVSEQGNASGGRVALATRDETPEQVEGASSALRIEGRLLGVDGQPLAGFELVGRDPQRLRWADAEQTGIVGGNFWMHVPPEERALLQASPAELDAFVERNFPQPAVGRALILGEEPPHPTARTDAEGRFELAGVADPTCVEPADEGWTVVGHGWNGGERFFAVARTVRLAGVVVDADAAPVEGAKITVRADLLALPDFVADVRWSRDRPRWEALTGADGRFAMEVVALREIASIRVRFEDVWIRDRALRDLPYDDLRFVLPAPPEPLVVSGTVLLPDGPPATRATVALAGATARTDRKGDYALEVDSVPEEAPLLAWQSGYAPAVVERFGERLTSLRGSVRGPALALGSETLTIRGRVVDRDGNGVRDARVKLLDGERIGSASLEDLAAGRTRGFATTDANGGFALDGLFAAEYRVEERLCDERAGRRGDGGVDAHDPAGGPAGGAPRTRRRPARRAAGRGRRLAAARRELGNRRGRHLPDRLGAAVGDARRPRAGHRARFLRVRRSEDRRADARRRHALPLSRRRRGRGSLRGLERRRNDAQSRGARRPAPEGEVRRARNRGLSRVPHRRRRR